MRRCGCGAATSVAPFGSARRCVVRPDRGRPAVHALLQHLHGAGLDAIPHVLGVDADGREILEYVPGDTADAHDPWPAWVWSDSLLVQVARWLRRYHDAVASFRPSGASSGVSDRKLCRTTRWCATTTSRRTTSWSASTRRQSRCCAASSIGTSPGRPIRSTTWRSWPGTSCRATTRPPIRTPRWCGGCCCSRGRMGFRRPRSLNALSLSTGGWSTRSTPGRQAATPGCRT